MGNFLICVRYLDKLPSNAIEGKFELIVFALMNLKDMYYQIRTNTRRLNTSFSKVFN